MILKKVTSHFLTMTKDASHETYRRPLPRRRRTSRSRRSGRPVHRRHPPVQPGEVHPLRGQAHGLGLFGVLLRTFEDFRYIGNLDGTAQTSADGTEAPSVVLLFRATVQGRQIHGIDLLQFDEAGLIKEFTVMVRPQSAVHALGEAVHAGLVADGLIPA